LIERGEIPTGGIGDKPAIGKLDGIGVWAGMAFETLRLICWL